MRVAGCFLLALGLIYLGLTARHLGAALTPLPHPNRSGLRAGGLYAHARHPMYGGVLMLAVGWSLALAPWGLLPTVALAGVLDLKSRREEVWLAETYPGYADYRERVRRRFWPGFY